VYTETRRAEHCARRLEILCKVAPCTYGRASFFLRARSYLARHATDHAIRDSDHRLGRTHFQFNPAAVSVVLSPAAAEKEIEDSFIALEQPGQKAAF
jgi:hypothetical protein